MPGGADGDRHPSPGPAPHPPAHQAPAHQILAHRTLAHQTLAHQTPAPPEASADHGTPAPVELAITDLRKRFGPDRPILAGVTLCVKRGQSVALIGANGAGKSTLLRCCLRLIEPDAGTIRLFGQDVRAQKGAALRRLRARVGFVFQRHNLVPRLSVLSNVLHGALARGGGARAWFHPTAQRRHREEAMSWLARVGLADHAGQRADRLSGGQSQRVAIARALMQRPDIIFADEPVASLDPAAGAEVMALFGRLIHDEGLTFVFATHHLRHALDHAERVIGLRAGVIEVDVAATATDEATLRHFYG